MVRLEPNHIDAVEAEGIRTARGLLSEEKLFGGQGVLSGSSRSRAGSPVRQAPSAWRSGWTLTRNLTSNRSGA